MANSKTESSTSSTLGAEYQVFLSFRGPDTRRTFTSSLYRALDDVRIRVFINDEELRLGERISGNLEQAIDDSKLYIPIFSKTYASSHWCLRELAKMVENTSKSKEDGKEKVILPIFYDVKPDDVKLKTDLYSEAILNLEKKMEDQKKKDVEMWRQALKEVGHIKGLELEKYPRGDGDLIKSVVKEVVNRLKTRQKQVPKDLVGMEDQIAAINKLVAINSSDVRLIVIYGMGGIGKTTLAKIIFNQLLPHFGKNCSFLEDVREVSKLKLVDLQRKLLSDISNSGVTRKIDDKDQGITMIEETICNKKMLIVLDDVDNSRQIQNLIGANSLCCGTRILVTTRDKSILNFREWNYIIKNHKMEGLSDEDALQLFSRHAFNDNAPPADYCTLSKEIISTADGLPLALEVIGAFLFGQENKIIWEEMLEKLRKAPHNDVLAKLRISYDALEPDLQQIFLDVACFFVGENKTNPIYVWNDCKFFPESAIDVLTKRCMIKVSYDDKFWMHDQFRDLGRHIAKQEKTRLRAIGNICCIRSTEVKGRVQALHLTLSLGMPKDAVIVTPEQIKQFQHLQFLWLHDVPCQGDFTGCLSELKWIDLQYTYSIPPRPAADCQLLEATNSSHLENVVVMNLSGLDFIEDVFESLIKGAWKLKVLNLCYNTLIHGKLTFPTHSELEKLTISKFLFLTEIDCSIGKLRWLTDLSFESCWELRKLPEQIGELQYLRHLSLRGCHSLSRLPNSVSKLKLLMKLDVSRTAITRLPNRIGRLPSLSSMDVSFTPIAEMPTTMSIFSQLQKLDLNCCCKVQELPRLPRSLTNLRLRSTSLLSVPDLSYLTDLVELILSDGSDLVAMSDIIQTCELPWIGRLSKLQYLRFCFSNVRAPTIELGSLSLLKKLTLHGLDLPTFEQLPSNLIVLELCDTRGQQVQLDGEKETDTRGKQVHLDRFPQLEKENKYLRHLELEHKHGWRSMEGSRFYRISSKRWVCPPEEAGCNELQAPELADHRRGTFLFPSSQKMLQELHLLGFSEVQDIQFVSTFESLEVFSVEHCFSLKSIGGLSNLKNLKDLSIIECTSLKVVEGIDELEYLYHLTINGCRSMERIFDASSSKIPNKCDISISRSGQLLDSGPSAATWESYKKKIQKGKEQAPDSETETTDSETETGDSLQGTSTVSFYVDPVQWFRLEKVRLEKNQENEEEETESANHGLAISAMVRFPENFLDNMLEKEQRNKKYDYYS